MLFILGGPHGSSWYPLLQLFNAHCQTSMKSRVAAAQVILSNYEIELEAGELACPNNVQPDLDLLRSAVQYGKVAAQKRHKEYMI